MRTQGPRRIRLSFSSFHCNGANKELKTNNSATINIFVLKVKVTVKALVLELVYFKFDTNRRNTTPIVHFNIKSGSSNIDHQSSRLMRSISSIDPDDILSCVWSLMCRFAASLNILSETLTCDIFSLGITSPHTRTMPCCVRCRTVMKMKAARRIMAPMSRLSQRTSPTSEH